MDQKTARRFREIVADKHRSDAERMRFISGKPVLWIYSDGRAYCYDHPEVTVREGGCCPQCSR